MFAEPSQWVIVYTSNSLLPLPPAWPSDRICAAIVCVRDFNAMRSHFPVVKNPRNRISRHCKLFTSMIDPISCYVHCVDGQLPFIHDLGQTRHCYRVKVSGSFIGRLVPYVKLCGCYVQFILKHSSSVLRSIFVRQNFLTSVTVICDLCYF